MTLEHSPAWVACELLSMQKAATKVTAWPIWEPARD
jgi:hypothetical protein